MSAKKKKKSWFTLKALWFHVWSSFPNSITSDKARHDPFIASLYKTRTIVKTKRKKKHWAFKSSKACVQSGGGGTVELLNLQSNNHTTDTETEKFDHINSKVRIQEIVCSFFKKVDTVAPSGVFLDFQVTVRTEFRSVWGCNVWESLCELWAYDSECIGITRVFGQLVSSGADPSHSHTVTVRTQLVKGRSISQLL